VDKVDLGQVPLRVLRVPVSLPEVPKLWGAPPPVVRVRDTFIFFFYFMHWTFARCGSSNRDEEVCIPRYDLKSYAGGNLKPDRSTGRGQTKSSPLVLQVGGCAVGLVTHPRKNYNYS
jgi:hypothetical protein